MLKNYFILYLMGNKLSKTRFIVLHTIIEKTKKNGLFYKWLNDFESMSSRRITWFKYLSKKLNNYSNILGNKNTNYKELILYTKYKNYYYDNI